MMMKTILIGATLGVCMPCLVTPVRHDLPAPPTNAIWQPSRVFGQVESIEGDTVLIDVVDVGLFPPGQGVEYWGDLVNARIVATIRQSENPTDTRAEVCATSFSSVNVRFERFDWETDTPQTGCIGEISEYKKGYLGLPKDGIVPGLPVRISLNGDLRAVTLGDLRRGEAR